MFKHRSFILIILCLILMLSLFGCAKTEQTAIESASVAESSKPSKPNYDTEPPVTEQKTDIAEPYYIPSFYTLDGLLVVSDKTQSHPAKTYHKDMMLKEYEQYENNYYYIVCDDTKSEIYHLTINSEPRLLYSTEDEIEHIAASKKDVFFTTANTFYSIPAEGGEAKELCSCDEIDYIDVINENTVILAHSMGAKNWDINLGFVNWNDTGNFDAIPYNWDECKYYCYTLFDNTVKQITRAEYINMLNDKEYFEENRFQLYSNHILEGTVSGNDTVMVFDRLSGEYKSFDDITYTVNAMSYNSPYFIRGNEVVKLTPYEETVICKTHKNIVSYCFDNDKNIYFVSEGNLYFANDNKGNNTLIEEVGEITRIDYLFETDTTPIGWKICVNTITYGDKVLTELESHIPEFSQNSLNKKLIDIT